MKVLFAEAIYNKEVKIPKKILDKLPKNIMLFMTAQLIPQREKLIKQLERAGKKVYLSKPRHTIHEGQLLGCDTETIDGEFEAFFYVGDGLFHPEALIIKNEKPVHIYNHAQETYSLLTYKDAEKKRKRLYAAKAAFLTAKNIGLLVTTKQGQSKLRFCKKLEEQHPDKKFFYLVNNNIEFDRLADFNFIDFFVNTACERIAFEDNARFEKPVINIEELIEMKQ